MVVTRRQSEGPIAPAANRSNSSSSVPRSAKNRGSDSRLGSRPSVPGVNPVPYGSSPLRTSPIGPETLDDIKFDDDATSPARSSPSKSKQKSKMKGKKSSKKRKERKSISIFDFLARLFLVWFTVYTLSVCPEDTELKSPVCRALSEYRRIILEPYVYPPIRAALDHPSISPHVQRVTPIINHAVRVSSPVIQRGRFEWKHRVVPAAQWTVAQVAPHAARAKFHIESATEPYLNVIRNQIGKALISAEPYITLITARFHQSIEASRPYAAPAWQKAKEVPAILSESVGKPLGDARRHWIDPHLTKILDAVTERDVEEDSTTPSTAATTPLATNQDLPSSTSDSLPTSTSASIQIADTSEDPSPASSSPLPEATEQASHSSAVAESIEQPEAPPISAKSPSVVIKNEPSATDEALASPSPLPEVTDEAAASAHSVVAEKVKATADVHVPQPPSNAIVDEHPLVDDTLLSPAPLPEPTDEPAASASSVVMDRMFASAAASSTPGTPDDEIDEDALDDFLSDFEIEEPEASVEEPQASAVHEETPEEREARLAEKRADTAVKRAEIEARHTNWEEKLQATGRAKRKDVRIVLNKIRRDAVAESKNPDGQIRTEIESAVQEGEKNVKSLGAFVRKLSKDADRANEEKLKSLDELMAKVERRYEERVEAVANVIREWLTQVNQREEQELKKISREVEEVYETGQADLGMSYAWLDDVSYLDWERYHQLMHTYDAFEQTYEAMRNGSAPNAPANPVRDIILEFQTEINDLFLGFQTSLTSLRTDAEAAFIPAQTGTSEAEDPQVSILPIDPTSPVSSAPVADIPPVILSRGAKEVEENLKKAHDAKERQEQRVEL